MLHVDLDAFQVRYGGAPVPMRPNELRLLNALLSDPDRVLTRAQMICVLNKTGQQIDERTVDVWIGRLRRALFEAGAPERIRTVRQRGYVWDTD